MRLRLILSRLRAIFRGGRVESDIDEEIRAHIEMRTQDNIRSGMTHEEAQADALRRFGNIGHIKDLARDVRGGGMIETFLQDLRYGVRMLIKNPGFTVATVLTLALCIGANTAIFSVVDTVLLRPLPFQKPESLVIATNRHRGNLIPTIVSYADFKDWSEHSDTLEMVSVMAWRSFIFEGQSGLEMIPGTRVSTNFFNTIGVAPAIGRGFLPTDEGEEGQPVAIISHQFWTTRLGADPDVLNKGLRFNDKVYQVIGVMPAGFRAALDSIAYPQIWIPFVLGPKESHERNSRWLNVIARLRPDVNLERAKAEIETRSLQAYKDFSDEKYRAGFTLIPIYDHLFSKYRLALLMLMGAVGFVLLIGCANVSNLLLARTLSRRKEMAIRAAMGAGRLRLISQLLTESFLLALLGGLLGAVLVVWGIDLVRSISPVEIPRLDEAGVDLRVFGFALAISVLASLLFGALPALRAARIDLVDTLKQAGSCAGAGQSKLRNMLLISEVSLTVILLVGAGLSITSLVKLLNVEAGFKTDNTLAMSVSPSANMDDSRRTTFYDEAISKISTLHGVESAGAIDFLPLSRGWSNSTSRAEEIAEGVRPEITGQEIKIEKRTASSGYFRAMQIPLRKGRFFDESDTKEAPPVAIINESLARQLWGEADPLGRRILMGAGKQGWLPVVGVVGDVRHFGPEAEPDPMIYLPLKQAGAWDMAIVARTESNPLELVSTIREIILSTDRATIIHEVKTLDKMLMSSVAKPRFYAFLLGSFAALAIALAAVGIYGVMTYSLNQRTQEIGIRMALGARPANVFKLVIGQGMFVTLIGLILGLMGAFILTRFLSSLLFGVSATDPFTFVAVSLLLLVVALAACCLPARRATKVDPLTALRYE